MNFSILNWNIQGKRYFTKTDFSKVAPALQASKADILCLQEAHRAKDRFVELPKFRSFDRVAGEKGYNQNLMLSRFPFVAKGEMEFPRLTQLPLENALWGDVQMGAKTLRVYNCHFGVVGSGPKIRAAQLNLVLDHANTHQGPVVICGDLNTTMPRAGARRKMVQLFHLQPNKNLYVDEEYVAHDERYLLAELAERHGFREAADLSKSTWSVSPFGWELFNMKLDWLLVRDVKTSNVQLGPYISDHRPIFAECSL